MEKLIADGAFLNTESEEVYISPIFSIPKKSGGTRLIHDLRLVNSHIKAPHFTLHGAKDAGNVVRNSKYICTLDLERGYQQIYMEEQARKYLGAKVGTRVVVSAVLPFGLSLSPYVFTRYTNWLAGLVRKKTGLHVGVYIDDFIVGAESKSKLEKGLAILKDLFSKLGVVLSEKKASEITREVDFLGFHWSAANKTVGIAENKRKEYMRAMKNLLRSPQPVHRWRSIIGKLIFLKEAIGPALRHIRSLLKMIRGKRLTALIQPSEEAREDLNWWLETLRNRRTMSLNMKEVTASITTDASAKKIGYILVLGGETYKRTSEVENIESHINTKELEALQRCIDENKELLRDKRAVWYSDNITAKAAITRQGTQQIGPETWKMTKKILDAMDAYNISLVPKHVPGVLNRAADALSRPDLGREPWEEASKLIAEHWGPLEWDPCSFMKTASQPIESLYWADGRTLLKPKIKDIWWVLQLLEKVKEPRSPSTHPSLWQYCAVIITPTW